MLRLVPVVIMAAMFLGSTGCAFKASEAECSDACENIAKVSQEEVEQQIAQADDLAQAGEGGKTMARNMASAMIDAIRDECTKQCIEKGTRKQAECLSSVAAASDLEKCL